MCTILFALTTFIFFKKRTAGRDSWFRHPEHRLYVCDFWLFTQMLTQDHEELLFLLQCTIRENFKMNTWFPTSDKSSWIQPLFKLKGALLLHGLSIFDTSAQHFSWWLTWPTFWKLFPIPPLLWTAASWWTYLTVLSTYWGQPDKIPTDMRVCVTCMCACVCS